jgi:hypothetical protein
MANLSNINNKFIVNDGGNILIGTTADVATVRLHVKNSSAAAVLRLTGGSDSWDFDTDYTANKLLIKSSGAAGTVMTLLGASGNVGIGTKTPATELQIGDYTDAAETITIATSGDGTGRINFYDANNTEGGSIRVVGQNLGSKMYFSNRWNTDNDRVVFDLVTGNVGIGVTPEAWASGTESALQIKNSSIYSYSDYEIGLQTNVYYSGGWKYINTSSNLASHYIQSNGNFKWFNAPGGTADASVTFTERMRITSGGQVQVGYYNTARGGANTTFMTGKSGTTYLELNGGDVNGEGGLLFADGSGGNYGLINYSHVSDIMQFYTASAEKMRITSAGQVNIYPVNDTSEAFRVFRGTGAYASQSISIDAKGGDANIRLLATDTARSTIFYRSVDGGGSFSESMRINNNGYVGIGTDSPTEKLEVKGNIVLNGQSTATGTTELDSLIFRKSHPSGASSGYYNQGLIKGVTYGGYAGGMNFYYNRSNNDGSGSYTNTQALWLNQYGNFCIGENSSSYKLRVKSGTIANNSVNNGVYISAGTSSSSHTLYAENQDGSAEFFAVRGDGEIRLNASSGHTFANNGIRFGTNAAANNLDSYEEGTFYATTNNDGVGAQFLSRYTKIGQLVTYTIYLQNWAPLAAGNASVTGFPFTAITSYGYGIGNVTHSTGILNCSGGYTSGTAWYSSVNNGTASANWSVAVNRYTMISGFYYTAA